MTDNKELHILESWHENAKPWINAIDRGEIDTRIKATNQAIVDTVLETNAKRILDVGCGEGWLSRELAQHGCQLLGIDVVAELIERARIKNSSNDCRFEICSYETIEGTVRDSKFDAAVCNFSLLGEKSVLRLLGKLSTLLQPNGKLFIQTVHPANFPERVSGWQEGSWQGFNSAFKNAPPWFYRTKENWINLLEILDYSEISVTTIRYSNSALPASLIINARSR